MTDESARKQGRVMLSATDQSYEGVQSGYPDDDDVWRAFLESPLTAASKAMLSVNGEDEEGSGTLGSLYDYYKIPRDKKSGGYYKTETTVSEESDSNKINLLVPYPDSLLTMAPLTAVPLHTVIHGIPPAPAKRGRPYPEAIAPPPTYSNALHAIPEMDPPAAPRTKHLEFGRTLDHRALGHGSRSPRTQTLTPDSTHTEASRQGFPLSENIQMCLSSVGSEDHHSYSSMGHYFEYILEAPQSMRPKSASGPTSYLNKGQFYPISLREQDGPGPKLNQTLRSVVMLVFGEDKLCEDQLKHWRFWQSRQHTVKQRCLDISDYKESFNTISNIEEIAYNAVSFKWDSRNEVRIFISVNCLSTDFSPQKGVRGLPLNLQIDSYVCGHHGDRLVHRAISQVKVFCDKGAERKIRDEERKQIRRKTKGQDASVTHDKESVRYFDITVFSSINDLESVPVLFIPETSAFQRHACLNSDSAESPGQRRPPFHPEAKRPRLEEEDRVLLYVRREEEEVFDALMLKTQTLFGLLEAVNEKYEVPLDRFGNVYKRCKKGMVLNVDDNIVKHCSNEDTFLIQMEEEVVGGQVTLTLTEI